MKKFSALFLFLTYCVSAQAADVSVTTLDDQKQIAVTAYNQGMALIKETRNVGLSKGTGELRFKDVPSQIMPETVITKSADKFTVLEQNYEYDLMSQEKVLDKYEGQKIKIVEFNEYQDRKNEIEATLLSNQGQIYQIGDEIYLGHPGYKVVPQIPDNLISKPTLMWMYQNDGALRQDIEVSYLTQGVSWKADYVWVIDEKDTAGDLTGWVTMNNQSGMLFKNAKLKLVAGDVNIAPQRAYMVGARKAMMAYAEDQAANFQEKAFFEYHLYDLQRPTTIKNNQTKQIELLQAQGVGFEKEYLVTGNQSYFFSPYFPQNGRDYKVPVLVNMKFINSQKNHLGQALPAGTMRFYKKDKDGAQVFIGSDAIDHTPTDEKVKVKLGEAFDIVAERKQTSYKVLTGNLHESQWEITLRNQKAEDVSVGILEPFYGDWKITVSSYPFVKQDAFSSRAEVKVPKKGEVKVTYTVQVKS